MVGACLYYLFAFASVLAEVQFFIVNPSKLPNFTCVQVVAKSSTVE